ncbi:MAG: tRNA (guanosine(37)-N1)-methyltransferase TrmD [Spirochaetae bacterium HGW-Spirochaetae-1]|nr:MAG: tRNA (guanosine(37)-N1)-methyltransferase TrmD [Spirochaetae bacterium HGW-Spirochaetae-1]
MIFNIYTLFPDFFKTPLETGLLGKAIEAGILSIHIVDIRAYSDDKFKRCDDYPYGGGSGMVLLAEPLFKALEENKKTGTKTLLTSPGGIVLDQNLVKSLAGEMEISIICGHYEGIDQRVIERYVDSEVSIGDYILSGGEFAALVIVDAVSRYIPGFMSNRNSLEEESFEENLLEYPQYTRPETIEGMAVPDVLLSGHHVKIAAWRLNESIEKTRRVRPDLYKRYIMKKLTGE